MKKNEIIEKTLEKLKELPHETQSDEVKKYSVETLDLLAIELYEKRPGRLVGDMLVGCIPSVPSVVISLIFVRG
jgi:hypothetical protein